MKNIPLATVIVLDEELLPSIFNSLLAIDIVFVICPTAFGITVIVIVNESFGNKSRTGIVSTFSGDKMPGNDDLIKVTIGGNGSVIITPVAVSGPEFLTDIV